MFVEMSSMTVKADFNRPTAQPQLFRARDRD